MSVKIITDFRILMSLAMAMGKAEQSGDRRAFEKAKFEHDVYKALYLRAESMTTGLTFGDV